MKHQHVAQQKRSRPQWNQTLYAYHEAGHAVVGHVIGRCISELSIGAVSGRGYKGYCQFSNYAEAVHDLPQWGRGSQNPERITVLYGGTVAMQFLCQERGWNYDRWRGCNAGDLAAIYLWSVEIACEEEAKQHALQRACLSHAQDILERYWGAVEALASVLTPKGQMRGRKHIGLFRTRLIPPPAIGAWKPGRLCRSFLTVP